MAKKSGVNKSQAIRDLLKENPQITGSETVATLAKQGIKVAPHLYYFVKGKMAGKRGRRRKMKRQVADVMASSGGSATAKVDVVSTIKKVKGLAAEVGGLKKLHALVEVLIG